MFSGALITRCIKPNASKKPMTFDKNQVLHQLRCGGVMECIRITKGTISFAITILAGYPTRKVYDAFVRRYKVLAPKLITKGKVDIKLQTETILSTLNVDKSLYQLGLTKVFLKAGLVIAIMNETNVSKDCKI